MIWLENLRVVWAGLGLSLAMAVAFVIWRSRGLLRWKRSLRLELENLRQSMEAADGARFKSLELILATCETLRLSSSLDLTTFTDLPSYVRKIAANYHPEESRPELCMSVGQLLAVAQHLADRLDGLLRQPGFDRLGKLRVRQVKRIYAWYRRFSEHPMITWVMRRRQALQTASYLMRFIQFDPLFWTAYLSQRLIIMMTIRCLVVDVFLFVGKSAMDIYESGSKSTPVELGSHGSQHILEAFENLVENDPADLPEELATIRGGLTGLPGRLWNPPGIDEWAKAVENAARVTAAGYFPDSTEPLDEATCRVLLERSRYWLKAMADARRLHVVRPLYWITLKRLQQIKTISESDLVRRTGKVTQGVWTAWRWARWPVKVLRWARRRSPAGVAVELGFTLAVKAMQNYLARYGFDRACRELDLVYRLSCSLQQDRAADKDQPPVESTPSD